MNSTKSLRFLVIRAFLVSIMLTLSFGVMGLANDGVTDMTFVAPEDGAAQVEEDWESYEKAMAKCKPLPVGEFPTAVVLQYKGEDAFFTKSPGDVNYLFKVAVGEMDLNPLITSFTLCK